MGLSVPLTFYLKVNKKVANNEHAYYLASHQMSSLKATLKRSGLVGIGPRMAKLCHLAKTAVALRRRFAAEEETFRQGLISTKSFLNNV